MPSTYSPLKIELPATGEQSGTWGNTTNTNLGTALEEAITGSANVTFASGNVTLNLTDTNASQVARNLRLNLIGVTGGSTRTLTVPAIKKLYLVSNNCADAIIVGNSTGSTVTVPAGNNIFIYNDGTDVLNAITFITSLNAVSVAAGSVVTTQVDITGQGDLRLQDTTGGQYVALQAPGTLAANYTLTLPVDDGTNGQALITDGSGVLSWSTAASGDVYGPASATDNAIARFDLTTGKIIQNSVVTVDDSGNIVGVVQLDATTVDTTNLEVTNLKAKDGTAAGSIANSTGVVTLGSSVLTTTDINGGTIDGTTVGASTASTGRFSTLEATGVSTFSAGTAALPAITTTGDTNTGIFFPAADTIAFTEGGVESMRIDSAGNVGIGTSSPNQKLTVSGGNAQVTSGGTTSFAFLDANNAYGTTRIGTDASGVGYVGTVSSLPLAIYTVNTERMRITSAGNVGIGTSSPRTQAMILGNGQVTSALTDAGNTGGTLTLAATNSAVNGGGALLFAALNDNATYVPQWAIKSLLTNGTANGLGDLAFSNRATTSATSLTERMRIDSNGNVLVGKTTDSLAVNGTSVSGATNDAAIAVTTTIASGGSPFYLNRQSSDGTLIEFRQENTQEGTISVSGTTVSYNGGHLSRWSQLPDGSKDDTLLKGTVLTNLDEMCAWEKDGVVAENEQLNKMKVSDVEGDTNVAGVFVNWTVDEQYGVDDMNVAMTGDMIIRIADGVVVQKGDLLMSAGDGTAKPQGDDIVRSKTIAKVTSNYVTCTYADGSYCVPCVLMAC